MTATKNTPRNQNEMQKFKQNRNQQQVQRRQIYHRVYKQIYEFNIAKSRLLSVLQIHFAELTAITISAIITIEPKYTLVVS
jgi:hypothetical protein